MAASSGSSPARGALLGGGGPPPITAPLLFARKRVPAEAFEKYDRAASGSVGLDDMRAAFSALGIKLSLGEAKHLVQRQSATGDKGGASHALSFNYRDFLAMHGAETSRAEAARGERNAPEEAIDVNFPPPQPSAANLIVERLKRERAPIEAGWMYSVLSDQPKMRPPPEGGAGEIDRKGGLAGYLAGEGGEDAGGESSSRRRPAASETAADVASRGEFTRMGIGAWNASGGEAATAAAGSGASSSREMHSGQIKAGGGLAALGLGAPPANDSLRPKEHPLHSRGELEGGLVKYLAEAATEPLDTSLPQRLPDQEFARRREPDPLHHGGELLTSGIGGFISDVGAPLAAGHIQGLTLQSQRKGFDGSIVLRGSLVVGSVTREPAGAIDSALTAAGSPSQLRDIRAEDEVPVLPSDVSVDADGIARAFRGPRPRTERATRDAAWPQGPSSEIDSSGGLSNFVASADPRAGAPLRISDAELRRVGHISKAGGVGDFVGRREQSSAGGGLAPLPGGGEFARQLSEIPPQWRGQIDRQGGLGAFLGQATAAVPEGYVSALDGSEGPRKRSDLDKAMIGTLDKFGGLAGFFGADPAELGGVDAAAAAAAATQGHRLVASLTGDFARQVQDGSLQRVGKVEAGGLGNYMNSGATVPSGYVAPLPGQNDDAPRLVQFANVNRGQIEQSGGLAAYLKTADEASGTRGSGYVLYPGEGLRRERNDPLHHYTGMMDNGFMGSTMGLDRKDARLLADGSLTHTRSEGPRIHAGRLGTDGDRDEPEQAVRREISLIGLARERVDVLNAHAEAYEREIMARMDPSGAATTLSSLSPSRGRLHHAGRDREGFEVGEAAIRRETSLLEAARERRELGRADTSEAEREVLARQQAPLPARPASIATEAVREHEGAVDTSYSGAATGLAALAPASPAPARGAGTGATDLRRLARVRKAIRDVLPKKGGAAVSLLRQRLSKEDGDGDGVVSDLELMRGLTVLNPGLASSDVGFIVNYLRSRARQGPADGNTGGLAAGIDLTAVADFITRQPGGSSVDDSGPPLQVPHSTATSRLDFTSVAMNYALFRAGWDRKHGAPARKEATLDAAVVSEGPSWTKAEPQPFKVLHLARLAPSP